VLLGAAILAAVVAVARGRPSLAGVLLGLGALVKISGLLPLVAVVAWVLLRRGWRQAARAAIAGGGVIASGYALVGAKSALRPLQGAASYRSRASFWTYPVSWSVRHLLGWSPAQTRALTTYAGVAVVVAAIVVVASRVHDADPAVVAGAAAVVYLLGAAYVLPWYTAWALPVLALAWRSRLALIAAIQAGVLLVVYVDNPGLDPDVLHGVLKGIGTMIVPVTELAVLLILVAVSAWRLRAGRADAALA
jgi:hypothetical protein